MELDDRVNAIRETVAREARRIADLGRWPERIDPVRSLTGRIPERDERAGGFDAGIACCLDLIPRDRQRLAAVLHAAYTPEAVERVRREAAELDADSDTCWWAAACSVCEEGVTTREMLLEQIMAFEAIASDPSLRLERASGELTAMRDRYELRGGIAFAVADGGMQGAYCDGHAFAAMHLTEVGEYFIGTYHPSLGLEDFPWRAGGGVHGSRQFCKTTDPVEHARALEIVARRFT